MKKSLFLTFMLFSLLGIANRFNMTGPGSISSTGGPYTYSVNLTAFGGQVAQGSQWQIFKNGEQTPVWTYPADDTFTGNTISIDLTGSTFGSTSTFTVVLTDNNGLIYGNKG